MPYRPNQFWLTVIKPYYKDNSSKPLKDVLEDVLEDILEDILENAPEDVLEDVLEENHNQRTLEGNYDSNTIVINIL